MKLYKHRIKEKVVLCVSQQEFLKLLKKQRIKNKFEDYELGWNDALAQIEEVIK